MIPSIDVIPHPIDQCQMPGDYFQYIIGINATFTGNATQMKRGTRASFRILASDGELVAQFVLDLFQINQSIT